MTPKLTPNHVSYLKARYGASVLRTATLGSLEEARYLVACLSTELLTTGTSRAVQIAERSAFAAILTLHERFGDRSLAAVAGEWKTADEALLQWMQIASATDDDARA